ncbi:MAG: VOC family protein [bacterium]|nr:VOC family protein [bacterium]
MNTIKNIRHTGIVVSDMERSLKFYRNIMGLKQVIDFTEEGNFIDTISNLKGVRLRMVKLVAEDGGMIELLHYASHPKSKRGENKLCELGPTHVAFTVRDVEKVYADWSVKGIRCNSKPIVSPDGKAKLFFCQDPDGTFLEIVQMLKN